MYSETDNHNYCHHEILLSAFPLALEWLDFDPEQPDKKGEFRDEMYSHINLITLR